MRSASLPAPVAARRYVEERRGRYQDVRACEAIFRDLNDGVVVDEGVVRDAFDAAFPNTEHRPAKITPVVMHRLLARLGLPTPPALAEAMAG